ncbi:MAG: hypothetical protein LLG42_06095 [Chloroflexi bacterium]|nr:hypothetical protein [Chloroflexota bacterium]
MNNELFIGLVKQLNDARRDYETKLKAAKELKRSLLDNEELRKREDAATIRGIRLSVLEKMFKKQMIDDPEYVPPFKAAWLINKTTIEIDKEQAFTWARKNMPVAISEVLNEKMLTDWAKTHQEDAPFAKIIEGKDARIASDLSQFLKDSEK